MCHRLGLPDQGQRFSLSFQAWGLFELGCGFRIRREKRSESEPSVSIWFGEIISHLSFGGQAFHALRVMHCFVSWHDRLWVSAVQKAKGLPRPMILLYMH